jgi:hypothetical protein
VSCAGGPTLGPEVGHDPLARHPAIAGTGEEREQGEAAALHRYRRAFRSFFYY